MTSNTPSRATAWWICGLVAAALYGNYYVYDSIGPVADALQTQRGFSDTQVGLLNAVYNLPNVVLILLGGVLVDRFGAAKVTLGTAAICLAGALLTALSPNFEGMVAGRLLFGIGAETFGISTLAVLAEYFAGSNVAFTMGLALSLGRLGSYSTDMSPTWFPQAYAQGWQPPLLIAAAMAAASFAAALLYWWLDRRVAASAKQVAAPQAQPFVWRDLLHFGKAYWYLLILCVLWYSVILAFRSTFSIKYFQHVHGLDLAAAGEMNSYVFLAAVFATPAFGWLCDRVGRYAPFLAFGSVLLPISLAVMALSHSGLWVSTALIGVSFSLVPAVMWPLASKVVAPHRFGTAIGLMWVVQNAGIGGANLVAGWLNTRAGASAQNPAGYNDMMLFFGLCSVVGAVFALVLWATAGRKHQELAARER
ncbi:MFS transporter [Roseateles depolymerans]|uniref:Lysosomal dipeptide transporter MFSD1 n=1 Tax=Roseateles depolymerans TaxID=76731 RepID=A0A0U3LLQ9_9BURK|nr:MFS transporter [Roseateles depolymerans]ALV07362.1 major facilitator transporter [Roseateles depolymerans]REG22428.1 nitrate/nitrite transporter NarK [Roseateles depolymerans]